MSDVRDNSLRQTARQLGKFVAFVAREFPLFHAIVALTFVVLVLEYAATSLMIPLSSSGAQSSSGAIRLWGHALDWMGLPHVPQNWLWLFFVVMAARLVFGYLQTASTTLLGKRVHRALSGRIFSHVVGGEPLTAVYQRSVGHYITLAGDDTSRCGTIITSLLQCCVTVATALVAIIILHQFSPPLFYAVTGFIAACAVTIAIMLRYTLRLNGRANLLSRELNTAFVEAINNLRSIRALHAEHFVAVNYAGQIAQYVWMLFKIEAVRAAIKSLPAVVLLIVAAVLMRSGSSVSISEATLLAVTIIIIRVFTSLGQFIGHGSILITDVRAIRDINALTSASEDESNTPALAAAATVESLELRGIDFGFSPQHPILKDFSFKFDKGRTYAIVGPSGSGKSTLADIMLGLVQPQRGSVIVNSGAVPLAAVRGKLMLVEQQPRIFSTTLRENLLFGFEASDEVLWEALQLVDLEGTVRHMRNGLDTVLSYQGENFSGGQRQRIGIARALVRTPDLLMLDEATSALDATTRSAVIANVKRRLHDGVLIMITHDTHLLELADEVIDFARVRDASRLAVVR